MGFSITWVAIRDIPLAEAALALGLVTSGQSDQVFDFDINGTAVGNWSVVIYNEVNQRLTKPGAIEASVPARI